MATDGKVEGYTKSVVIPRESEQFSEEQIVKVENLRHAKFVIDASESPIPVSYFYTDEPHPEGSNYFKLYYVNDQLRIADGKDVEDMTFSAIELDGILYHSRNRWDCRIVGDSFIDGGQSYVRTNCVDLKKFVIRDGDVYGV